MFLIEATRRASRAAVAQLRAAIVEYDRIVFSEVDVAPDEAFRIVFDNNSYVLAFNDPSFVEPTNEEERTYDCGD
jgi:hypothetical protein